MRSCLILFLLSAAAFIAYSQDTTGFEYKPYFSAMVVKNVDSASRWYSAVFGLKVTKEINDSPNVNHVIILESPAWLLELLQLKGAVERNSILQDKPRGTQIQGHFKTGFKVTDMDDCLKRLAWLSIIPDRIYTDDATKKRNFLLKDPDGNWLQFFE